MFAQCPGRLDPGCMCAGTCRQAPSVPVSQAAPCTCLACSRHIGAGFRPLASFASQAPAPRGSGAGMHGFAGEGEEEFEFAVGSVSGLRQWTLAKPEFSADPHKADRHWTPSLLVGATGFGWPAGVLSAFCNNGHKHRPPVEVDPETEMRCGCVSPETRVLTADLRWVPAGDLVVGEHLTAFDEHHDPSLGKSSGRRYRDAVVANTERGKLPCYDLLFEDGTAVRVSADHRWLCYNGDKGSHWVRTDELRAGDLRASHVVKPFDAWGDLSSDGVAGYLAGAFDGEGCLSQHPSRYQNRVSFIQVDNLMLAQVERYPKKLGFDYNHAVHVRQPHEYTRVDGTPRQDTHILSISRKPELLQFLGSVRPVRLLDKFQPALLGRVNMSRRVRVVEKTYVGEREVVMLGTTAGTYIAEAGFSHNCGFWAYWDVAGLAANRVSMSGRGLPVLGVISGYGRVLIGDKGFRSEKAEITALAPAFSIQAEVPWEGSADFADQGWLSGSASGSATLRPSAGSDPFLSWAGQHAANELRDRESADVRRRAQEHADAWMAVIQARLMGMYPGARVYATAAGLLASERIEGKP